ncbi:MAG TPA: FtsX-like permease family protein [Methylotenera sp.]|nr:FtsX-like permease family protein [Methylotenera sp.]HPH04386.1 FtsX-like permease family protein [Methylotenera sp.]HPM99940.1 FtsX-like permease family protein [Methylotenera sp.]
MNFKLAWQQLVSQYQSGDLRVLLFALVLAVTSMTAVSFFTNRIALHLNSEGGLLLGGDLVILSDHALPNNYQALAQQYGLQTSVTFEFPSMAINGDKNLLAEVKALSDGFPLRGDLGVQFSQHSTAQSIQHIPHAGEVWVESRLANAINVNIGDPIELGASTFKVAGIITREPSRGGDMFGFAPRLMMNSADLAATELIQFGSRVKYQLLVAGEPQKVQQFSDTVSPLLQRGERIQDVKNARPEIKSALDKAETFLGLSAMVSVVLSVVAMLLASGPFVARSLETAALLRCFGASKATIQTIMLQQTALLALIGGVLGCVIGFLVQSILAYFAGRLFFQALPAPNYLPVAIGMVMSFSILFAMMWPHIQAIKNVPTMRILRNDVSVQANKIWLQYLPVALVIAALILWLAKTWKLAGAFLVGILSICLLAGILAYAMSLLLSKVSQNIRNNAVSLGLANLKRRLRLTLAQMIGFSLGAMVLMLLLMTKNDLMQSWQSSLPTDAPNRFIINIQAAQIPQLHDFFKETGVNETQVFAMIRGRLVAKNGQTLTEDMFESERAKRLFTRETNLSTAATMQADNKLLAGRWWRADEADAALLSLEYDVADALNIKLGDTVTYDIAGSQIDLKVTSIRKVEWDTMRPNFFAQTPPNTLANFPASYMTAFYLPKQQENALNVLLQKFPNFTVIDVASLMQQVRGIMQKMSLAIGFVFTFCIIAGLVVLYAALVATRASRIKESAMLRVLGASRRQTALAMLTEFACIGAVAASVAIIVASSLAYYLSRYVLEIPYQFNVSLALSALLAALVLVPLAAWWVIRAYLNVPPKQLLNSI